MSADTNSNEEVKNTADQSEQANGAAEANGAADLSVEELRQKLDEAQKSAAEFKDSMLRARADFANLKRRTEQERANLSAEAREKLLLRIIPVVDDFERALQNVPDNLKGEPWINGVTMIEKKLKTLLEQENVSEIPAEGQEFDPRYHEAVQQEDGEGDKEVVTAVYQKGYKLGDKVIRAAVVKVGRK
ncbi:MAG TPA: nucleotide exchange factor GrpE [Chloroflexia bacterium]|nr:nucleotide exchange factor GrpE [Chloroflexia bacterium]